MLKTFAQLGLLALAATFCMTSGARAAMPISAIAALPTGESRTTPVSFWAQPYPYRYVPWRRCPLVRVETPYGWYRDRVCVTSTGPVLRRAF